MGLAQLFLHFSISPRKGVEFDPARVLRTFVRFVFMKNKDHILSLEFCKDHFKYQHDGSSSPRRSRWNYQSKAQNASRDQIELKFGNFYILSLVDISMF